jgi:molecular chaperone DnaJ
MEERDHYVVLGVARDASPQAIRSAFRALAKSHHPDRAGPESATRFARIYEAYATLSDAAARRAYDAELARRERPKPPVRLRRRAPEAVIHGAIVLSPEEARRGARLGVRVPVTARCGACGGTGWARASPCPTCRGAGRLHAEAAAQLAIPAGLATGALLEFALGSVLGSEITLRAQVRVVR